MGRLIIVPIESIESRYTGMMNDKLKFYADAWIYPDWTDTKIETGQFLDVNKTSIFKSMQLQILATMFKDKKIKNGDKFLIADIFFPGIEMLRYLADLQDIKIEIYGINHAGRADKYDFVQKLGYWAKYSETGYHSICNKIFVGSRNHMQNVMKYFHIHSDYIVATGQVWDSQYILNKYEIDMCNIIKEDYIIWPHRWCEEKNADFLIELAEYLPEYKFVITAGIPLQISNLPSNILVKDNLTKKEYYDIFAKAKWYLNTSLQETFGYTIQEAIVFECNIIAHDFAAITEMVPSKNLYKTKEDIKAMLTKKLIVPKFWTEKHDSNLSRILTEMGV